MSVRESESSDVHRSSSRPRVVCPPAHQHAPRKALGGLLGLVLLVNLAINLYQLPLNRVVERRLCREYYVAEDPTAFDPNGELREDLCKIDDVQRELAWIQGVMETAWIVGDFFVKVPLGFLAEKYGGRIVLWVNLVPRLCVLSWAVAVGCFEQLLPTKALLAAPMLSILGGDCVFNSIVYSLASDMTEDRTLRATYFAYAGSASYVVALLGPALASATMSVLLWLPFYIGIVLLLASVFAIAALPSHKASPCTLDESEPLLSSPLLKVRGRPPLVSCVANRFAALRETLGSHLRNFSLLLAIFFLTSLASSDTKLLVQHISKRYCWTFASAGYLLSGKAVVNFALLTIVVPRLLKRGAAAIWKTDDQDQDQDPSQEDAAYLFWAKSCMCVSALGAAAIASAATALLLVPALLTYALGSALPVFAMSLLKLPLVTPPPRQAADGGPEGGGDDTRVFAVVMLVKTLGSLAGAPLMAAVWMRGIAVGGPYGLGLPYCLSAACYVAALVVVSGMEVR